MFSQSSNFPSCLCVKERLLTRIISVDFSLTMKMSSCILELTSSVCLFAFDQSLTKYLHIVGLGQDSCKSCFHSFKVFVEPVRPGLTDHEKRF